MTMVDVDLRRDQRDGSDPTQPIDADESLGDLLSQLSHDFSNLISTHVELAKSEIRDEAARAGKAAGMLGGAAFAGYLAVLLASFAVAWGLDAIMPAGWAFAIVAAVWALAGGALFVTGRVQLRAVHPVPPKTKQSLQEDLQWARQQTH